MSLRAQRGVALVTGAGNGLGQATAIELASQGFAVVVNDLGTTFQGGPSADDGAASTVEAIVSAGGQAVIDRSSVSDPDGANRMVALAVESFGSLNVVVHCAGVIRDHTIANISDDDWDVVVDTNLRGTFLVTRAALPHLKKAESGSVITMSSSAGIIGNIGSANYAAAKAGVVGFTKVLALELERHGVTANTVVPFALTRMAGTLPDDDPRLAKLSSMKPERIAAFVAALVDPTSSDISGQIFGVRGSEIIAYSQIRPVARAVRSGGWTTNDLISGGLAALRPSLTPLVPSTEIFNYDTLD
ncbi:hypothetical protein ASE01_17115 [Nocardioides sp. Root190]|uniref:SDR family NAD(P)-dependent oxidoreductase n=1 Tax=Nocardioides sp. Root190 TaxID=1736488 RepID=UPI0006F36CE0|nr:SDR family NAD(P)-dependent oxidoreductase [Nocardioides sp. Root190]KRB75082.1 hypothetical protein ASE01_17115 [Nocardioides sp. Root190]